MDVLMVLDGTHVVLEKVHHFGSSTVQVKYKPLKINRVQYGTSTPIFFRLESSTSKSTSTFYCFQAEKYMKSMTNPYQNF